MQFHISNKTVKTTGIVAAILLVLGGYFWVSYRQGDINVSVNTRIKNVGDSTNHAYVTGEQTKTAVNKFFTQYNAEQKRITDSIGSIAELTKGNGSDFIKKFGWVISSITNILATQKDQQKSINALKDVWQNNIAKFYGTSGTLPSTTSTTTSTKTTIKADTTKKAADKINPAGDNIPAYIDPISTVTKSDSLPATTSEKKKSKKKGFSLNNLIKKKSGNSGTNVGPFWSPIGK